MATHLIAEHRLIRENDTKNARIIGEIRHRVPASEKHTYRWEARLIPQASWDWIALDTEAEIVAWLRLKWEEQKAEAEAKRKDTPCCESD